MCIYRQEKLGKKRRAIDTDRPLMEPIVDSVIDFTIANEQSREKSKTNKDNDSFSLLFILRRKKNANL